MLMGLRGGAKESDNFGGVGGPLQGSLWARGLGTLFHFVQKRSRKKLANGYDTALTRQGSSVRVRAGPLYNISVFVKSKTLEIHKIAHFLK